ncbi:MAG: hypothetical protein RLP15_12335 [Cryomorphaceae bacterium]
MILKSLGVSILLLLVTVVGYAQGSVMLATAESATVIIDGQEKVVLEAYTPHRVELTAGEHTLHAVSSHGVALDRSFTVVEGKQQLIQIEFPAYVPPPPKKKAVLDPIVVTATRIEAQSFVPFNVGSSRTFKEVSEAYFTFSRGDTVLIDVASETKDGTFFVELIRYTDWTPVAFKEVRGSERGIKVPIERTEIFILRIGSTTGKDQMVKLNVKRIPAAPSTKDFITHTEKYSLFELVPLLEPTKMTVNSTSHEKWQGGKNETSIPLDITPDIMEWYYTVAIDKDEVVANQTLGQFSLMQDLQAAIGDKKAMTRAEAKHFNIDMKSIKQPKGTTTADVYLLTYENAQKFAAEELFVYIKEGTREAISSAKIKVTCCTGGHFYLGIRNKDVYQGVHVVVEAVGVRKGLFLARPVDRE